MEEKETRNLKDENEDDIPWLDGIDDDVNEYMRENPDRVEIPNFVPTRFELRALVTRWARVIYNLHTIQIYSGSCSRSDWAREQFAIHRIMKIEKLLGEEFVRGAIHAMHKDLKRRPPSEREIPQRGKQGREGGNY